MKKVMIALMMVVATSTTSMKQVLVGVKAK